VPVDVITGTSLTIEATRVFPWKPISVPKGRNVYEIDGWCRGGTIVPTEISDDEVIADTSRFEESRCDGCDGHVFLVGRCRADERWTAVGVRKWGMLTGILSSTR
jgi:hypothetical protein